MKDDVHALDEPEANEEELDDPASQQLATSVVESTSLLVKSAVGRSMLCEIWSTPKGKRIIGNVLVLAMIVLYAIACIFLLRARISDFWQFVVAIVGLIVLMVLLSWYSCFSFCWKHPKRDFAHMSTFLSIVFSVVCLGLASGGVCYAALAQHVVIIDVNGTLPVPSPFSPSSSPSPMVAPSTNGQCKCEWPLEEAERLTGVIAFFLASVSYFSMAFGWSVRLYGSSGAGTTLLNFYSHLPYDIWKRYWPTGFLNLHNDMHTVSTED